MPGAESQLDSRSADPAQSAPPIRTIFVTGYAGFVGSALRARLARGAWHVRGLARQQPRANDQSITVGDLLVPDTYQSSLVGVDAVVHLAAQTGKARARDYWKVNRDGTSALLAACKRAGVKQILHVSTIAAGFSDRRYYPYAQSKLAAEALVRESGLAYTILRPTIVLGATSPLWSTLSRMARLPFIPLPQGTRPVSVQPVHVNDVARAIEIVLEASRFEGETLDVGGQTRKASQIS